MVLGDSVLRKTSSGEVNGITRRNMGYGATMALNLGLAND